MKRCPTCRKTFAGHQAQFCPVDGDVLETTPEAPAGSMVGTVLDGKYAIESLIGEGGMGAVYRARHLHLERMVAVKVLRADLVADATAAARFRREAQAAARLVHPNAVAIHDFGISPEGSAYLVMELLDGKSLRAVLDAAGPMSLPDVSRIIGEVCAAMDTAHKLGIVHRDLKPDNIVIGSADGRVKVVDFGIAMLQDASFASSRLTGTGMVVGTASYMSPEHCKGEVVDARSDIYSLGVVLYEMITGRVPFDSPVPSAVIVAHVNEPPPPMRSVRPDLPVPVEQVVLAALSKSPSGRPATAQLLAERFRDAVDSAPSASSGAGTEPGAPGATVRHGAFGPTSPAIAKSTNPATTPTPGWQPPQQAAAFGAGPIEPTIPVTQHAGSAHVARRTPVATILAVAFGSLLVLVAVVAVVGYVVWNRTPRVVANDPTPPVNSTPPLSTSPKPQPASPTAVDAPPSNERPAEGPAIGPISPTDAPGTADVGQQSLDKAQVAEVEKFLKGWVSSAMARDVDWNVSLYAPVVDYYKVGPVPRPRVRLDRVRAYEKYDSVVIEIPRVHEATATSDGDQFRLVFDKSWTFNGPAGRTTGKVRQLLLLRRFPDGLKIVAEKDLEVY